MTKVLKVLTIPEIVDRLSMMNIVMHDGDGGVYGLSSGHPQTDATMEAIEE